MQIVTYTSIAGNYDKPRKDVVVYKGEGMFTDPKRESNIYAAMPHKFFEADYSIWVAGNVFLKKTPKMIVKNLLKGHDICLYHHHKRDCIYDEGEVIRRIKKDKEEVVDNHMQKYKKEGYPENNGLVETGIIIRKHSKQMDRFNEAWFAELCTGSRRQQLSFNYVLSKFPEINARILNENIRKGEYVRVTQHKR